MPETVLNWGNEFIIALQAWIADWALGPLNFFTFLGYEEWFLMLMPFVFWCIDAGLGLRLAVFLAINNLTTASLKTVFHDPRPYWVDARVRLLTNGESSFGIPSGHASNGIVVWGALAHAARKPWAWGAAMLIALLIGSSRVFLGVHFPTDVLAGWALGVALLYLLIKIEAPLVRWYRKFKFPAQVLIALGTAFFFILAGLLLTAQVQSDFALPAGWVETALAADDAEPIDPFHTELYITNAAVFFGAVTGYTWLLGQGGFSARGPWSLRFVRYALGMAVAIGLWAGLDAAFAALAEDATLGGMVLRFVRYTLIGLWVGAIGPRTFIRLGWAKAAKPAA